MSSQVSTNGRQAAGAAPRRELNHRQAETVDRLVAATRDELRGVGFDALTVRTVAARAEVAPATAYTYFASKNHLVAEAFWRSLQARPLTELAGRSPLDGVVAVFIDLAAFLSAEPELAAATTIAMLGPEPDVRLLREQIGAEIAERLVAALGADLDPDVLEALLLSWAGATLQAGMGHTTYKQMGDQLARVARTLMGERR